MSQSEFKKRLKALMNRPENQVCSDCPERQPRWASLIVPPPGSPPGSLPFGAFCCLECSGSHRRLGVHISFVRSITLDSWKEKEVLAMENGGNAKVNAIFEAQLHNTSAKPTTGASGSVRERYIRDKYERRKYYDANVMQNYEQTAPPQAEVKGRSPARTKTRAPSEAARLRAQARKRTTPKIPSTASSIPKSRSVPAPVAVAPPEVDLLDFSAPIAPSNDSGRPKPPSAAPSPTLDMFKNMNMGSNGNLHNMNSNLSPSNSNAMPSRSTTMPIPARNNLAPQMESKKMTSDDILAMFHTPSVPQQQMPQQNFANFGNFQGHQNSNMNAMNNQNQMNNNTMMNNHMGNMNNSGMMGRNSYNNSIPQQQQQQNMFQSQIVGGSGMNMNSMAQMGGNSMMPMGGSPANMNVMGGNGMAMNNMNMGGMNMSNGGMNSNNLMGQHNQQSYNANNNVGGSSIDNRGNQSAFGTLGGTSNQQFGSFR